MATEERSPVAAALHLDLAFAQPFGPTMICPGRPIRSAVANFAPGRSSVSSTSASLPCAAEPALELFARGVAAASPGRRLKISIEGRDGFGRDDAGVVMGGLDHRRDERERPMP